MGSLSRVETLVVFATALAAGVAATRAVSAVRFSGGEDRPKMVGVAVNTRLDRAQFALMERGALEHAPFRLAAERATVRFGAVQQAPATFRESDRTRYSLDVHAIVGGPPWQAVVAGLPGVDGPTVVRTGDAYLPLMIRSISADRVIIQGPDTSWILILPHRAGP